MGIVVPDPIPSKASEGEKRVHTLLKRLPDSYISYYEPFIDNRRPDFIFISPDLGILVIEVKGYYPISIAGANDAEVIYERNNRERREQHPLAQARDYMWRLFRICEKNEYFSHLINSDGRFKNKFIFPFGHVVVLSNCHEKNLTKHELGDLTQVFRPQNTIYRDTLIAMEKLTPEELCNKFKSFFDPFWSFPPLNEYQIKILRSAIHPEFIIQPPGNGQSFEDAADQLKILDHRQETSAARVGEGHRIIYGVVGSGKTVILVSRAKILKERNPEAKILVLCYNVSLSIFLQSSFEEYPEILCTNFHDWARKCGISQNKVKVGNSIEYESDESLGERFSEFLSQNNRPKYDAIFIDEAQDFDPSWIKCAIKALNDPIKGDLFIVCDGNQGIYSRKNASWSSLGVNAQGRSYSLKMDLHKNYRNTREILQLAYQLVSEQVSDEQSTHGTIKVNPDCAIRSGPRPILIKVNNHMDEWEEIFQYILAQKEIFKKLSLKTAGAAILYPRIYQSERNLFSEKVIELNKILKENGLDPAQWVTENSQSKVRVKKSGLKIMTIHSSKGLQFEHIFLIYLDTLNIKSEIENLNSRLCYIGMTRSEKSLALLYSGHSEIVEKMISSGNLDVIEKTANRSKK